MFARARNLTLNLAQWLARIANSYVADDRPEDRVLLSFSRGIFVTKPFDREFALELRLPSSKCSFRNAASQYRISSILKSILPQKRKPGSLSSFFIAALSATNFRNRCPT